MRDEFAIYARMGAYLLCMLAFGVLATYNHRHRAIGIVWFIYFGVLFAAVCVRAVQNMPLYFLVIDWVSTPAVYIAIIVTILQLRSFGEKEK